MDGKNGIKITNYWSCVNGRRVENDTSSNNQDQLPSSSSSSSSQRPPPLPPLALPQRSGNTRRRQLVARINDNMNNIVERNGPVAATTATAVDTSIRAADSTSTLTTITSASSTSGHSGSLSSSGVNMMSSSASSWNETDGPADSTVTLPEGELSSIIYEDDDDSNDENDDDEDMDQTDEDNDSTIVEGSHSFDLTDMMMGTLGGDISRTSYQFNKFDEDFQLAYEFLESDGLIGVDDKENDQPGY